MHKFNVLVQIDVLVCKWEIPLDRIISIVLFVLRDQTPTVLTLSEVSVAKSLHDKVTDRVEHYEGVLAELVTCDKIVQLWDSRMYDYISGPTFSRYGKYMGVRL